MENIVYVCNMYVVDMWTCEQMSQRELKKKLMRQCHCALKICDAFKYRKIKTKENCIKTQTRTNNLCFSLHTSDFVLYKSYSMLQYWPISKSNSTTVKLNILLVSIIKRERETQRRKTKMQNITHTKWFTLNTFREQTRFWEILLLRILFNLFWNKLAIVLEIDVSHSCKHINS